MRKDEWGRQMITVRDATGHVVKVKQRTMADMGAEAAAMLKEV